MSFYLYYVWQFEGSGIQIPDRCQLYEDSYIVVTTWQLCFVNTEVWDLEFGLDNLVKRELYIGYFLVSTKLGGQLLFRPRGLFHLVAD